MPSIRQTYSAYVADILPADGKAVHHASATPDSKRARIYAAVVYASLSDDARRELRKDMQNLEGDEWLLLLGREQGAASLFQRLLTARFGTIAPEVESRIKFSSIEELCEASDRIWTAESPEQLFEWL